MELEVVSIGFVVYWLIGALKDVTNRNVNGLLTRAIALAAGAAAVWAYGQTDWAEGVKIGGQILSDLNAVEIVLAGLSLASLAGTGSDALRAFNRSDESVAPKLLPDE